MKSFLWTAKKVEISKWTLVENNKNWFSSRDIKINPKKAGKQKLRKKIGLKC